MESNRTTAYRLDWELEHLEPLQVQTDVDLRSSAWEYEATVPFTPIARHDLPEPVVFSATHPRAGLLDFPYNLCHWPIVSTRMLEVLISTGLTDCKIIPVALEGSQAEFHCLHLLNQLDLFDWDASEFLERSFLDDRVAAGVTKYVIEPPPNGFPALFRLSASPVTLFVSGEARLALKRAGITGVRYLSLEGFDGEVDVPIPFLASPAVVV